MFATIKKYLTLILAVATVILFIFSNWFSYKAGINKEKANDAKAMAEHQKVVTALVDELEIEKAKKKVIVHEKIIKIKQAVSECADVDIDQPILDQLQ